MNMDAGRNDLCPCGSGKKYKKCCLTARSRAEAVDFEYKRLRDIEAKLIPKLLRHSTEVFGTDSWDFAWDEFNDFEPEVEFDPEAPMNQAFMPWFLFNWTEPDAEEAGKPDAPIDTTVCESFVRANARKLSSDEKMILDAANRCPFSFCEILEVRAGTGLRVRDLFLEREFDLIERSASQALRVGEILFCGTMHLANRYANISTGPFALAPVYKQQVLELRRNIIEDIAPRELTRGILGEFDADIRGLYLDAVKTMTAVPKLQNTDGDPMVPQKLIFDVSDADFIYQQLKGLQEGATDDELANQVKIKDGKLIEANIDWLGGKPVARKRLAGPVLLGRIKISGNQLTASVNSEKRAKKIRKEIEQRCGSKVVYKTTLIEPVDSQLKNQRNTKSPSGPIPIEQLPPEALASLKRRSDEHWDAWFDIPVPALNNETPRQAAKTPAGRDLLKSLLLYYEQMDSRSPNNLFRADVNALRQKLGLV
jgi:hypothetical protein